MNDDASKQPTTRCVDLSSDGDVRPDPATELPWTLVIKWITREEAKAKYGLDKSVSE